MFSFDFVSAVDWAIIILSLVIVCAIIYFYFLIVKLVKTIICYLDVKADYTRTKGHREYFDFSQTYKEELKAKKTNIDFEQKE